MDYPTILAQLRAFLMDTSAATWADADLQEAVHLSLLGINLLSGQSYTLSGLDGATATSLPAQVESALTLGAAGYAAAARAIDRAENYELTGEAEAVHAWAEARLAEFRAHLALLYPNGHARTASQRAAAPLAYARWGDDFGEKAR